jgi:hypothetical protein
MKQTANLPSVLASGTYAQTNDGGQQVRVAPNPNGIDFAAPLTVESMTKAIVKGNEPVVNAVLDGNKVLEKAQASADSQARNSKGMYIDPVMPSRASMLAYQAAKARGENVHVETPAETKKRVTVLDPHATFQRPETPEEYQRRMERVQRGTVTTGGGMKPGIPLYPQKDEWKIASREGRLAGLGIVRGNGEKMEEFEARMNNAAFQDRMKRLRMTGTLDTRTQSATGRGREVMPPPIGTYINSLSARELMKEKGGVDVTDNEKLPKPYAPGWGRKMDRGSLVVAYDPKMFPITPETVSPPVPMSADDLITPPKAPTAGPNPAAMLTPPGAGTVLSPPSMATGVPLGVPYSNESIAKFEQSMRKARPADTFMDMMPPIAPAPDMSMKPLSPQERMDLMPNGIAAFAPDRTLGLMPTTPEIKPPAISDFDMPTPMAPVDDNLTPNRFGQWVDRDKITHEDAMEFIRARESVLQKRAHEENTAAILPIPSKDERLGSIQASIAAEHLRWPSTMPTETHEDHLEALRQRHSIPSTPTAMPPRSPMSPGYGVDVPVIRPEAGRLMDDVGNRMTKLATAQARTVGEKTSPVRDSRTVGLTPAGSFSNLLDEDGVLRTADASKSRLQPMPLQDIHERIQQEVATSQPEIAEVTSPAMETTADNTDKMVETLVAMAAGIQQLVALLKPNSSLSGDSNARTGSTRSNLMAQRSPQYHQLSFGQYADSAVKGVINDGVS